MHKLCFQRGNAGVFAVILLAIAIFIGLQIQDFANFIKTDFRTACWVLGLFAGLAVLMWLALTRGSLSTFVFYLPAAILFCLAPALSFWAWEYVLPSKTGITALLNTESVFTMRQDPLWYGKWWVLSTGIIGLSALGHYARKWYHGENY